MSRTIVACLALCVLTAEAAQAQPSCSLPEEKKRFMLAGLCGAAATEQEYKFSGPNCIVNSTSKRLEDSAIQIISYRMCGDDEFSARLREATLKSVQFIQALATCSSERIDVRAIMDRAIEVTEKRAMAIRCDADMRKKLADRKPAFERMMVMANDPRTVPLIYEKLGIAVDSAGNITEKR